MIRSFFVVACFVLAACTAPTPPTPDGGGDGGPNPNPIDACSGGCGVTQKCDTVNRVCVDGCDSKCDGGTICQKQNNDFQCTPIETRCGATTCSEGEVACLGGACACLGPARGTFDSCFGSPFIEGAGQTCGSDGRCVGPKRFQQCKAGGANCPTGLVCNPVFGDLNGNDVCDIGDTCSCTQPCASATACPRGDACFGAGTGCLPQGLGRNQECAIQLTGVDAGFDDAGMPRVVFQTVTAGSVCLRKDENGSPTETTPTGTCTYAFFSFADQGPFPFDTCRPPGAANENTECVVGDNSTTGLAVQCNTGLECAGMRGADKGLCLRTCNALPPSVTYPSPQPSCGMGEACVNLYRREDVNRSGALLGVCTKSCNVFDPAKSACAPLGTTPAVCVPTNADGRVVASNDGSGVCIPQRQTIAQLDMPCDQTDPFKGSACGNGQVCPPAGTTAAAVCTQICDFTCSAPTDGGSVPARCATEVNATCPAGKTCRRVTTTTGSRVGFCQ